MASLASGSRRGRGARVSPRPPTTSTRTLISPVSLNRPRGKIIYRVVLTLVIVVFTLVFIGPMYFLFTDGLKSTQEAIASPPTLYPHHIYPGTYKAAWDRLDLGPLVGKTPYLPVV